MGSTGAARAKRAAVGYKLSKRHRGPSIASPHDKRGACSLRFDCGNRLASRTALLYWARLSRVFPSPTAGLNLLPGRSLSERAQIRQFRRPTCAIPSCALTEKGSPGRYSLAFRQFSRTRSSRSLTRAHPGAVALTRRPLMSRRRCVLTPGPPCGPRRWPRGPRSARSTACRRPAQCPGRWRSRPG